MPREWEQTEWEACWHREDREEELGSQVFLLLAGEREVCMLPVDVRRQKTLNSNCKNDMHVEHVRK